MNQSFGVNENNLHDENGLLKATSAYHSGKSSKPSRGARSCHAGVTSGRYTNDSSDSESHHGNNSFRSTFNAADISKRHFRRSSKRHKKVAQQSAYDDYDEQSSSNASHVLQSLDMNVPRGGRIVPSSLPDYYRQPKQQYEDAHSEVSALMWTFNYCCFRCWRRNGWKVIRRSKTT
jgi:hypothetical protein